MSAPIQISPTKASTKFAAVDANDNSIIIAEGKAVDKVIQKANKSGKDYCMIFIPEPDTTYIL